MYFDAISFLIFASIRFISSALVEISCTQIIQFVNGHNSRRLRLAEGKVPHQPKAALMYSMVWDKELSQKAADWAARNNFTHNPDVTIASRRFITGENIHMTLTTNSDREFNVEEALASWWSENKNFVYEKMNEKHFKSKKMQVGHYTQMAWADSIYLGCAVSKFNKDKLIAFMVVCYYGPPGNIINEYPYIKEGKYGHMLKCHESVVPNCADVEYGDCKLDNHTSVLRMSSIMDLDGTEKDITATVRRNAVGAVERVELVELHENVMAVPLLKKYTPLR